MPACEFTVERKMLSLALTAMDHAYQTGDVSLLREMRTEIRKYFGSKSLPDFSVDELDPPHYPIEHYEDL